ncbi:nuclear transport factor 2 family protein [Phaeovulum sp.]|uniref:nuclear transport factor 2 family protein n=1 Tax=Phaeovulum sp. TaxID=2934796 RepID=UPI0039E3FD85
MNVQDHTAIAELAQTYFDALYEGDAAKFEAIFHADGYLHSNGGNAYAHMDVPTYLNVVRNREAPAARGEARADEVLGISFLSPTLAILTTREVFLPKLFTDVLVVVKFGDDWKIVSKAWDFTMIDQK